MKRIITYIDGSGNTFIMDSQKRTLEFKPVKPLYSSSGIYDGGDYKKKELGQMDYDNLMAGIQKAIENNVIHIENRIKRSGLIKIQENNNKIIYIINPDSEEQIHIEGLLKDLMAS